MNKGDFYIRLMDEEMYSCEVTMNRNRLEAVSKLEYVSNIIILKVHDRFQVIFDRRFSKDELLSCFARDLNNICKGDGHV